MQKTFLALQEKYPGARVLDMQFSIGPSAGNVSDDIDGDMAQAVKRAVPISPRELMET